MLIDHTGVTLASYFPNHLYRGRPQSHVAKLKGRDYLREAQQTAEAADLWQRQMAGAFGALGRLDAAEQPLQLPDQASLADLGVTAALDGMEMGIVTQQPLSLGAKEAYQQQQQQQHLVMIRRRDASFQLPGSWHHLEVSKEEELMSAVG